MSWVGIPLGDIPVDPNADEARELLIRELSKPEYASAQPTLFDRFINAVMDWLDSLHFVKTDGPPGIGTLIVVVVVIVIIGIAFLVFGLPRLRRRSSVTGELFGEDDDRTSVQLRYAAEAAAARGEYGQAIADLFRSIARSLAERTVLTTWPGTTAHDFAGQAAVLFPERSEQLAAAAAAFDGVRYLSHPGTVEEYEAIRALEGSLRNATPARELQEA